MRGSGSSIFIDADDFQGSLPRSVNLLITPPDGDFKARLTWVKLPHLHLLHVRETLPRVAYVSLSLDRVHIDFPTQQTSPLIYDGIPVHSGEIIVHSIGEQFHERTVTETAWGSVSVTQGRLLHYYRIVIGSELDIPSSGRILRLAKADQRELLRVHAATARAAETALNKVVHPQVARALEQDLIPALLIGLANGAPQERSAADQWKAEILTEFESVLSAHPDSALRVSDFCHALKLSERALQACCSQVLGMSAARYLRLRKTQQLRRVNTVAKSDIGRTSEPVSR